MKEIRVVMGNNVGALANLCRALGGSGVNIESIVAYEDGGQGVARIITGDEESAAEVLKKSRYKFSAEDILTHKINDNPGELSKVADRLADAGVNLECIYILSKNRGVVELALKTDSDRKARAALEKGKLAPKRAWEK